MTECLRKLLNDMAHHGIRRASVAHLAVALALGDDGPETAAEYHAMVATQHRAVQILSSTASSEPCSSPTPQFEHKRTAVQDVEDMDTRPDGRMSPRPDGCQGCAKRQRCSLTTYRPLPGITDIPPAPSLVGIEPNPGPFRPAFRAHGRYCGPKYTGGQFNGHRFFESPDDRLDAVCKRHDYNYTRMPEPAADAIMISELDADFSEIPRGNLKATAMKYGFLAKNLGRPSHPGPQAYPWDRRIVASTATTQAVEPNPGPKGQRKMLKQHGPKRGGGPKARAPRARPSAPVALGSIPMTSRAMRVTHSGKDTVTLSGRDFLQTISIASSDAVGDVKSNIPIHPDAFAGTNRLAVMSQLYERYLFHPGSGRSTGCRFHLQSSAPTSDSGSVAVAIDMDPGDAQLPQTGLGAQAKAWALGHNGHIVHVWENTTIALPNTHQQKDYWVDDGASDPRLCMQGRFYAIVAVVPATTMYYDLWMDWHITFRVNQLDVAFTATGIGLTNPSTTGASAANPLGTAAPSSTSNLPSGIGIAYNGTDSLIYQKAGSPAVGAAAIQVYQLGTGIGTTTLASLGLAGTDPHTAVGTTTLTSAHSVLSYSGLTSPTAMGITAGYYWNGASWVAEVSTTVPVLWYVSIHYSAATTITGGTVHIIPISTFPTSLSRNLRHLRLCPTPGPRCTDERKYDQAGRYVPPPRLALNVSPSDRDTYEPVSPPPSRTERKVNSRK